MSIDRRLREGLNANTDVLLPQVDLELGAVLRRAHRRRRARVAVAGLATAVALATGGWLAGVASVDHSQGPSGKDEVDGTSEPISMAGYEGPIAPDEYAVPLWGDPDALGPQALVDVPAGYISTGGWAIQTGDGVGQSHLSYWYANRVAGDPCASRTTLGPLGPTAKDLVMSLQRQPGIILSRPEPVTLDGHDGFHLTYRVPPDTDPSQCERRSLTLWTTGDYAFGREQGTDTEAVTHLWILDVDGRRMIIALTLSPRQADATNAELLDLARSTHFVDPAD